MDYSSNSELKSSHIFIFLFTYVQNSIPRKLSIKTSSRLIHSE